MSRAGAGRAIFALPMLLARGSGQEEKPVNVPSPKALLRRSAGTTAVLGNYIYYDGGELSELGFTSPVRRLNGMNATISIDLSRSWSPSDVEMKETAKPPTPLNRQALLKDPSGDAFYIWGGALVGGMRLTEPTLWKFTADGSGGGSWSEETDISNRPFFEQLDRVQGAATVSTPSRGFVIGGASDRSTAPEPKSRIVGYVALDFDDRTWSQEDQAPYSDTGTLFGGRAVHVPGYGREGIVVLLGGGDDGAKQYVDFGTIYLFDLEAGTWHSQETTGPKPSGRALHCVTGVAGNGTYEIFLYGGEIVNSGRSYSDMYALSLPGFRWTRLAPEKSPPARRDHACETVGKRQMLSWGGLDAGDGGSMWANGDAFPQSIGIFDMATLQWTDRYDADAEEYETHESIRSWYDEGGLSTVNWTSTEVETLFASMTSSTPTGEPSSGGGGGGSGVGGEASGDGSVSTGAIAGAVVGGVGGLAIVGGLLWYLLRRRRREKAAASPATTTAYAPAGTQEYYPQQKAYNPEADKYPQYGGELDGHSPRPEMQADPVRFEAAATSMPAEMPDTSRR